MQLNSEQEKYPFKKELINFAALLWSYRGEVYAIFQMYIWLPDQRTASRIVFEDLLICKQVRIRDSMDMFLQENLEQIVWTVEFTTGKNVT